jgi:hypothetical protein
MNANWLLIAIFVVGISALIGFFATKTKGFGRFNTSTFLLLLVLVISGLFYAADKMQPALFSNILFAIIGFAGGLFTGKKKPPPEEPGSQKSTKKTDTTKNHG